MVTHKFKKLPKNTFEIEATISRDEIAQKYAIAFEALNQKLAVEGFRKGKVPTDIAKKQIPQKAVYEEILRILLPKVYEEIIKKENIKPIVSPKIRLLKAERNEDWLIEITTAEKPVVNLGNFKEVVKKVLEQGKKADIWVPGQNKEKPKETNSQAMLDKVLSVLLDKIKVEIADLIIEQELNQRLARLVDDIEKVGLTVDAYLKSKNTTMEHIREQIKLEIENIYRLEFILGEIADQEKITVENKDLEEVFAKIKNPKEKEMAQKNAYFYASLIRKQKAIDFILSL